MPSSQRRWASAFMSATCCCMSARRRSSSKMCASRSATSRHGPRRATASRRSSRPSTSARAMPLRRWARTAPAIDVERSLTRGRCRPGRGARRRRSAGHRRGDAGRDDHVPVGGLAAVERGDDRVVVRVQLAEVRKARRAAARGAGACPSASGAGSRSAGPPPRTHRHRVPRPSDPSSGNPLSACSSRVGKSPWNRARMNSLSASSASSSSGTGERRGQHDEVRADRAAARRGTRHGTAPGRARACRA